MGGRSQPSGERSPAALFSGNGRREQKGKKKNFVWEECRKEDALQQTTTKVVFIYDRMAMLLREMLTLSMLAERFKLARKISAANLSSQTRDMASS